MALHELKIAETVLWRRYGISDWEAAGSTANPMMVLGLRLQEAGNPKTISWGFYAFAPRDPLLSAFILELLYVIGSDEQWETLVGRYCRAEIADGGDTATRLGHASLDRWFDLPGLLKSEVAR